MGTYNIIVDHLKLEYGGVFDPKAMFKLIAHWFNEREIQKSEPKYFEQNLADGKCVEYEYAYWRRLTDYNRMIYKIRILIKRLVDIEVMHDKKKIKMKKGEIIIHLDGYINWDDRNRWESSAMLQFIRTMFHTYFYAGYQKRMEEKMAYDMHDLYNNLEKFFNIYTEYRPVTKMPHFYY